MARTPSLSADPDIVVVGGGAVGLTAAVALAQKGFSVTLIGRAPRAQPGRTVALLQTSVALLSDLGVWSALAGQGAPLKTMRIVDATGSLFRAPPVTFEAREIGLEAFGLNVGNAALETALRGVAAETAGLTLLTDVVTDVAFTDDAATVSTESGHRLRTRLVVAADGRGSPARKAARIGVHTTAHPQTAITAVLTHAVPHDSVSTEFHTRQGPFTLVPLPDDSSRRHRSSLVWVMSPSEADRRRRLGPEALAQEAEQQCRRLLGAMQLDADFGLFPIVTSLARRLTASRLVLIGEAAHALPPIGAQGLNLSLRDVGVLSAHLGAARRRGDDIGAPLTLAPYGRSRARDIATRSAGVGLLNQSLLARWPGADLVRSFGLLTLQGLAPARRFVMCHGLTPNASGVPASPRRLARP